MHLKDYDNVQLVHIIKQFIYLQIVSLNNLFIYNMPINWILRHKP